jgi:superfamily II DNA/RNA helicase
MDVSEGFMLTMPQRQISSSMAAACKGWLGRLDEIELDDEQLFELNQVEETKVIEQRGVKKIPKKTLGDLIAELVNISREVGNVAELTKHDSKYRELVLSLKRYWKNNPAKKVVLFAFYKNTLHYLEERLKEDGISSVVVHGGMDKQKALQEFEDINGPRILLSSEVAAEGVDLQFSSLLINYDLPWNPNRLEQREGRIDRVGQQADTVEVALLYGSNNPIDGVVLEVLLRKSMEIRKSIGISVPFPENSASVMEAVTNAILLKPSVSVKQVSHQLSIFEALITIIFPPKKNSFCHLPLHLRRCLSIFPIPFLFLN